jgi:phage FluMu protein Com
MMELKLDLDFACGTCGASMTVTVKCAGKGLAKGSHSFAAVKVPCPTCNSINELVFDPNGTVHAVSPCRELRLIPEPSLN